MLFRSIDKSLNGELVNRKGPLYLVEGEAPKEIVQTTRINIDYAEEYKDVPWRFYIKDNPYVSIW